MAITTPPMGIGEAFGVVRESTFGTGVDPTVWWRPISNTLKRKDPVIPLSGPTGSAVALRSNGRAFRATPDISGTVVLEAEYDDIGYLFGNALEVVSTAADTPVVNAHEHTYTLARAIPATTPVSLTCARVNELEALQFQGCMINSMEISGAAGRIVTLSMDIITQSGGNVEDSDAIGTLSAAPFVEFHDSQFRADFAATGTTLVTPTHSQNAGAEAIDWTVRIDNNYRRQQAAGNGVRGDREYTFAGYRAASLTVSRDFFDDNFFDLYNATGVTGTFGTFGVNCTSDEFITGSTPYSLDIQFSAGQVAGDPNEYGGGPEILGENITINAGDDGTNAPVSFVLINGTTSY